MKKFKLVMPIVIAIRPQVTGLYLLLALSFLEITCGLGWAQEALPSPAPLSPLEQRAQEAAKLFSDTPTGISQLFDVSFLNQVSEEKISALCQQVYQQYGSCQKVVLKNRAGEYSGTFQLHFEKGFVAQSDLSVDSQSPHLISGWLIKQIQTDGPPVTSFDEIIDGLKKLPGKTAFAAARLDAGTPHLLASWKPDTALALGSAFKLYVLAELVREIEAGERKWDEVIKLDEASQSLPSGDLRTWPIGSPITLHTLAALMISKSDNTATDEMIHILGRQRIETMQAIAEMQDPNLNIPFPTTLELFRLKYSPLGLAYLKLSSVEEKRAFLDKEVADFPRDRLEISMNPKQITTLEWYATANDLCRIMAWLARESSKQVATPVAEILQINPGLPQEKKVWRKVAYKGGSEPGVLNLTFWLVNARGTNFLLTFTWNNPDADVDEKRLTGLVQSAINLLATE